MCAISHFIWEREVIRCHPHFRMELVYITIATDNLHKIYQHKRSYKLKIPKMQTNPCVSNNSMDVLDMDSSSIRSNLDFVHWCQKTSITQIRIITIVRGN